MGKAPKPPGGRSPQPKLAHFHDRGEPPDRREIAVMPVLEGARRRMPLDCRPDHPRDVPPLLLRGRGKPWNPGTCPPVRRGRVADREDPRAALDRKIVIDDDAPGLVSGLPEPLRGRRRGDPGGPERRSGGDAGAVDLDALLVDIGHFGVRPHLHAQVPQ